MRMVSEPVVTTQSVIISSLPFTFSFLLTLLLLLLPFLLLLHSSAVFFLINRLISSERMIHICPCVLGLGHICEQGDRNPGAGRACTLPCRHNKGPATSVTSSVAPSSQLSFPPARPAFLGHVAGLTGSAAHTHTRSARLLTVSLPSSICCVPCVLAKQTAFLRSLKPYHASPPVSPHAVGSLHLVSPSLSHEQAGWKLTLSPCFF